MGTFTNSITNIVNSGYVNTNYTSRQITQIAESIKNSAIDTVKFSDESKNLFQISQIDNSINGIFGMPNTLDANQQKELDSIRKGLDTIYPTNSSQLQQINFDEIFENLGITGVDKEKVQNLSNELSQYLTQRSIGELFGNPDGADLSFFTQGYDKILTEKLNEEEISGLGSLSVQLNRLFFSSNDNQVSSYLNLFNDIYGLNNPSEEELFNANSLLTQRNTLLSSTLLARDSQSSYNN